MTGQTPWEFACEWYGEDEIFRAINQPDARSPVPRDVSSREFADWLTRQYRLAMNKGIELGQRWCENAMKHSNFGESGKLPRK